MYRNCIFCSAELGANDALESFPVGTQLAFDAWKGRLWAVCPVCARWNLSPIEERWEAVEAAEKLFRDARLRVHSENVGVAQLPDGTRLVRVGSALPGELAAWRYGRQLLRRRKRYFVTGALGTGAAIAAYGGIAVLGVTSTGVVIGAMALAQFQQRRVIHRMQVADDDMVTVRRWHLDGISMHTAEAHGDVEVHVRDAHRKDPPGWSGTVRRNSKDVAVVTGASARALLARTMVHVNRKGATTATLGEANRLLENVGSVDQVIATAARAGAALGNHAGDHPNVIKPTDALVLEMALHEESERRALEGELAALEAAWREAEEIAAIADSLPGSAAMHRLIHRLTR